MSEQDQRAQNGVAESLPAVVQTGEVRAIDPPAALDRVARVALAPAVIAATGGFLAGVATFVVVRLLRRRPAASPRRAIGRGGRRRRGDEVIGSRSFLVDVHLLRR